MLYDAIMDLSFISSEFDSCIFVGRNILLVIHVNDILVTGAWMECDELAFQLNKRFNIVNNGHVSSFLGINIERANEIISRN